MTPGMTFYKAWTEARTDLTSIPWGTLSDRQRVAYEAAAATVLEAHRGA